MGENMITPNTLQSKLLYATTRITTYDDDDQPLAYGTAFFFEYAVEYGKYLQVLVTNKHVVEGAKLGAFHVHKATEDGSLPTIDSFEIIVQDFEKQWISHPSNLDLCVLPFNPLRRRESEQGRKLFIATLDENLIPAQQTLEELAPMEDIIMVGYPIGLWDDVNNFPIFRRGVTAFHPALDYQGQPRGVVDIAAFPGSSGSPIVIANDGSYTTPMGLHYKGGRLLFLGILSCGPMLEADGTIVTIDVPTVKKDITLTNIPIHLGYYIKSKELVELKIHLLSVVDNDGIRKA